MENGITVFLTEKELELLMGLILDRDKNEQEENAAGKIYRAYYAVKQQKKMDFIE